MPPFDTGRRAPEDDPQSSSSEYLVKNVLLTVKTYPLPSNKYDESVCSVGITDSGEWIRIYPLPWFALPEDKQPQKYQWMSVPVKRRSPQDRRPESYQARVEDLQLGRVLGTGNNWRERSEIVLPMRTTSIEEMLATGHSIALIKPANKPEFIIEQDKENWGPKKEAAMKQIRLLGKQRIQLRKIPWKFSYKFMCQDSRCVGHKLSILDWEVFMLYETMRQKHGNATDAVLKAVEETWLTRMWDASKDSYLYIGTTLRYNSPVVLGVYYPKVEAQTTLF